MIPNSNEAAINQILNSMDHRVQPYEDPFFQGLRVEPADLLQLMLLLQDQAGMNYLADITATDRKEEFEVTYHLYAIPDNQMKIVIKTRVPRDAAELPSVFTVYPTSDWQEREIFDLMGIRFSGHPNLVRVLLPDEFEGHPLRKDFRKEG